MIAAGDPLERLATVVDFEVFRGPLAASLRGSVRGKSGRLPIEGEIAHVAERERIKQEEAARLKREAEEKAAQDRAAWLRQDVIGALGHGRLAENLDGGTRLSLASASDSTLGEAWRALAAVAHQWAAQDRRDIGATRIAAGNFRTRR